MSHTIAYSKNSRKSTDGQQIIRPDEVIRSLAWHQRDDPRKYKSFARRYEQLCRDMLRQIERSCRARCKAAA